MSNSIGHYLLHNSFLGLKVVLDPQGKQNSVVSCSCSRTYSGIPSFRSQETSISQKNRIPSLNSSKTSEQDLSNLLKEIVAYTGEDGTKFVYGDDLTSEEITF